MNDGQNELNWMEKGWLVGCMNLKKRLQQQVDHEMMCSNYQLKADLIEMRFFSSQADPATKEKLL